MEQLEPSLEAVYYGSPVPRDRVSLTLLGLVFDKLHFPSVYLPTSGYDLPAALSEADRIERLGLRGYDSAMVVSCLRMLKHMPSLSQFCVFSPAPVFGLKRPEDSQVAQLVHELELQIFGPSPPGFISTPTIHHHKGLPGGEEAIDYPGALYYLARALTYAGQNGIPIVNDNVALPVPGLGGC